MFLSLAPAAPFAAPADPQTVAETVQTLAKSGRYQTELPDTPPPPPPREPWAPNFSLGPVATAILIAVLIGALLFVLAPLVNRRIAPTRKGAARRAAVTAVQRPSAPSQQELLDAEARALAEAEAGRIAEAIHVLLLGAIGRLRERDAKATRRSYTSREILAAFAAGHSAPARATLGALVAAVEITRFGGKTLERAEFERCLEAYRAFRNTLAQTASPAPRVAAATA